MSETYRIVPYTPELKSAWDQFVRHSKNGTFLFLRDYMEYHGERFQDCSLVVQDERGEWLAILPANRNGEILASHGGLTFGGFVTTDTTKMPRMLHIFEETLTYLQQAGVTKFIYKTIPHIYHRAAAEEDRYALFLCDARVKRRGVLTIVTPERRLPFQERRARGVKKAERQGLVIRESKDYATFWEMLSERLWKTFGTRPVHSLAEIESLHARFPNHIRLFGCFAESEMLAGVVVYESDRVAHVQYIASSEQGRAQGALDLMFHQLLDTHFAHKPYFDFGTSDEDDGHSLNHGLMDQKEGFGARVIVHDHYEIDLTRWERNSLLRVLT